MAAKQSIMVNKGQGGAWPHTYVLYHVTLQGGSITDRSPSKKGKYNFLVDADVLNI